MFPDRESCLRRSTKPAKSAKAEPAPTRKQAEAPAVKKPVKQVQKVAEAKPKSKEPAVLKKSDARLPSEADQTTLVMQSEPPATKLDRNLEPAAPQPVVTAKLALPPAEPVTAADKQTLGRRIALIIGNSTYAGVPVLKNPATDARAIADTLTGLGFEKVTLKLDLDRQATWAALAEFADDAARADWAVVYYAGHGIELDGQNYLIPVDAKLDSDRRVLFETVPLDHVVEATAGARKFRLVILDACRNNPFLQTMTRVASTRSIGRGLSRVEPQGGVLVAYAAKAGEVALDGDTGNSPFVVALIEQLRQPGVEVGFLFRKVRDSVLDLTNGTQEPYTYGSLPGREELYFNPPAK
ncbi:caspase family protein [Aestuariivirga sp. YIM B02566]|uniref:Caspase family protein n=1 Tax=Taklimakanibacter albus TaxID=2800327 RepID=A0ACC5R749_9HYPH|nr:caspase family protein [Aestuariivirga sp. YIM B02566]MBK1868398.1 caspase family protein [Aestuariivirga sp. YIM B02566]